MADREGEFNFFQRIHVRIGIRIDFSISIRPMITRFGNQIHLQDLTQIRIIKAGTGDVIHKDHLTNQTHCISTTRMSMATKLGRMVTYLDDLLPIKSHDPLITQSFEIILSLYLHYHSAYGQQTWQDDSWWLSLNIASIIV